MTCSSYLHLFFNPARALATGSPKVISCSVPSVVLIFRAFRAFRVFRGSNGAAP